MGNTSQQFVVTLRLSLLLQRAQGKSLTVGSCTARPCHRRDLSGGASFLRMVAKGGFATTIQLVLESLDRMVVTLLFMRPNLTTGVVSTICSLL